MQQTTYESYITDESGEVDVNYYINKAHRLRNKAISDAIANMGEAVKVRLQGFNYSLRKLGQA